MDKNDIIEYAMNTPHNTNRAVLSSMLNQLTEGGGGGGSFIIGVDHTEGTFPNANTIFDKTWKEVNDALARGERVVVVSSSSVPFDSANQTVILNTMGNSTFVASGISANGGVVTPMNYYACSADGYLQDKKSESSGGGSDLDLSGNDQDRP